ncbi:MAG: hypothetical protein K6U74_08625 [Firmicutes bacterium]|nr:hypothetical protein [Bacillota bacterium]
MEIIIGGGLVIVASVGLTLVFKDWREMRCREGTVQEIKPVTVDEMEKIIGPDPVVVSMKPEKSKKGKRKKYRKEAKKQRPLINEVVEQ